MQKSGINMERVKKENRSLILKCINNNGPLSRKDIAAQTGLTPASVTQITTLLIDEGILLEVGSVQENTGTAGRKKILLDINESFSYVCSVNIEQKDTTIAICDLKGQLKNLTKIPTANSSPEEFLTLVSYNIKALIGDLSPESRSKLKCISVGIPGIVNKEKGLSVHAYGIWNRQVNIRSILEKNLNLPVIIENNVNAFGNAEILFGLGRSYDSLLIIKWGPGVGSTIVADGKVYEGRHGKTAELGHFIAIKNGKKCNCGRRGCLETIASYDALSEIMDFKTEEFENKYLSASTETKDAIDNVIDFFARSLVNTCTIIAPNRIVLSGSLFAGSTIRDSLIGACENYDPAFNTNRIRYTSLSDKESYIGPAAVYINRLLF